MKASDALKQIRTRLLNEGKTIKTLKWQGDFDPPSFLELLHLSVSFNMEESMFMASKECGANQPWADEHFGERVSGLPLNPPPSHLMWNKGTTDYLKDDRFSHSYPERMWSKDLHNGIRFGIADLSTLVKLFRKEPDTRQGYLPIFFPEDLTAAIRDERVPCTLGWHFIIRDDKMDVFYPMRSCDALRHVHNDFYFANCLALWLITEANLDCEIGKLYFHATSFHCFENDRYPLSKLVRS